MVKRAGLEAWNEDTPDIAPAIVLGIEFNQADGVAVADAVVQQDTHPGGGPAIDDELHAAIAQHGAVWQRVVELQRRRRWLASSFGHDHKSVTGEKIRGSRKHGAPTIGSRRTGRLNGAMEKA